MAGVVLASLSAMNAPFAWAASPPVTQTNYDSVSPGSSDYDYWVEQVKASGRVRYVPDPEGQRGIVQRIEVKSGDTQVYGSGMDAERAEVTQRTGDLGGFVDGQSIVISFGVLLDPSFSSPENNWNIFSQIHAAGGGNRPPFSLSFSGDQPEVLMALEGGGQWQKSGQPDGSVRSRFQLGSLSKGEWHDFVVELQFGCNGDGHVTVWLDGQMSTDADNQRIGYCGDPGMYWKQGVYRAADDADLTLWFSDTYRWADMNDALAHYGWG
ncbi:heparin lyase I family protein [Mycolicibacterium komossense]|uniref:Heparin lyase I family protein n=2 Tax=Mycolicibacterium komossense TaxID=1779 RepID=A0ABT3CDR2_9MYCO|nr:heparin lyase I family protein [Mycolicibacterium komossense]